MPITAMSTFDSGKEGLQDVLNEIDDAKIQLPDFQRDWRWDDEHIRSLLASVSLSYPIGAILLMETGGTDGQFAPRLLDGVSLQSAPPPQRLILDGQQRLTALYQVLKSERIVNTRDSKNQKIQRWYYLDINKALDSNADREEAIISLPEDRKIRNFRGEVTGDYSDLDKECSASLLPLSMLFDIGKLFQWLDKYTSLSESSSQEQRREARNKLTSEVIARFQQYQIPVIELKRETPKEAVCQVFEKVNTGGVSLTVFELVTATFAIGNFRLRDDWAQRERQIKRWHPLTDLSSSDFLTAATLLSTWERHESNQSVAVSCKRRDILRMSLSDYLNVADRLTAGFENTARFLIRQKIFKAKDVPYQTQLIPLVTIITALGGTADQDTVKQKIARWFWCGILGELYGAAVESRFARDLPEVIDWVRGGDEPSTVKEYNFVPQRLGSLRTRNSAAYKGLHALLMREGGQDFRTGDTIELQTYFDDSVDIHHVFPRNVCSNLGIEPAVYNSIVNKTPLSARTNRTIGGNLPSIYLDRLQRACNINEARMDEILRSHLIDPIALRADNFKASYDSRQNKILELIERATGKGIVRAEIPSEPLEAEEEEEEAQLTEQEV
jgi:hypothetical protein